MLQSSLVGHTGKIYGIVMPGDLRSVVTVGTDRAIKVWDLGRSMCT
jgi:WD40 repeat protein